jgi:hypothetical protein
MRLGYGALNDDLTLVDNYLTGYTEVRLWQKLMARGNTFVGPDSLVRLEAPPGIELASYGWDGNVYQSTRQRHPPLVALQGGKTLASAWREWTQAGLDRQGKYTAAVQAESQVFVRPNRHEPGRGHIIVYNWDQRDVVEADLAGVLKSGQSYRVVSAQDYFGRPVLSGAYEGKPLRLPMKPIQPPRPVGMTESPAAPTAPEFEVFVIVPDRNS